MELGTHPLEETRAIALEQQPRALEPVKLFRLPQERLLERRLVRALLRRPHLPTRDVSRYGLGKSTLLSQGEYPRIPPRMQRLRLALWITQVHHVVTD